jgi:hypothetical protein
MEEWEAEEGNVFVRKIRRRGVWLLFIIIAGVGAGLAGKLWLFVEAQCPRLQDIVLYIIAGGLTLLTLFWAALTRNDSPVAVAGSIIVLPVLILVAATLAGGFLSVVPYLQSVYCPPRICDQARDVRSYRESGKLNAAEEAARDCLRKHPSTQVEKDCQKQCASELIWVLYERSDPGSLPTWERGRKQACSEYATCLKEALELSTRYELRELAQLVQERQKRLGETCAIPTPYVTPTPVTRVNVLRTRYTEKEAFVDVRVFRGMQSIQNLRAEDFHLFCEGKPFRFKFEMRSSDDPVCLIAVVDNSGSVRPGLEQIRRALRKLNDARKPGDKLGMVVFAGHDEISVHEPSDAPLPTDKVDATGSLTALWDATLVGLETAKSCPYPNQYLVLLTDGRDNDSRKLKGDNPTRAQEIARRAADQGVFICTVGVASKELEPEPLRLAASGCGYYPAENFDQVASLFQELFGYMRDFYRLRIEPGAITPGSKCTIQVRGAEVSFGFSQEHYYR